MTANTHDTYTQVKAIVKAVKGVMEALEGNDATLVWASLEGMLEYAKKEGIIKDYDIERVIYGEETSDNISVYIYLDNEDMAYKLEEEIEDVRAQGNMIDITYGSYEFEQ